MRLFARRSPHVWIAIPPMLLAFFPALTRAQNPALPTYTGVVESIVSSGGNETNSSGVNRTWSLQQQVKLDVRLEKHSTLPMLAGNATGTVSINFSYTETLTSGCKNVRTVKYSGPYVAPTVWYNEGRPYMTLVPVLSYYELYLPKDYEVDLVMSTRCFIGTPELVTRRVRPEWGVTPIKGNLSLDGVVEGHREGTLSGFPNSVYANIPAPTFSLDYRLTSKQEPEEVELVVEPQGYDTWRPQAGANEDTRGNSIDVLVALQASNGGEPKVKAKKFTYELSEVSSEPGIAMNYPLEASGGQDLRIDGDLNPQLEEVEFGRKYRTTTPGDYTRDKFVLSSYDWGGWAVLKVSAELTDGREIVGYLKGNRSEAVIRFPKRTPTSHIADIWKQEKGVDLPDNDDSENAPAGDGHAGVASTFTPDAATASGERRARNARPPPTMSNTTPRTHNRIFFRMFGTPLRYSPFYSNKAERKDIDFRPCLPRLVALCSTRVDWRCPMKHGAAAKVKETVKIKKPLPIYSAETLPVGTEITLTPDWEPIPNGIRGRIILDPQGNRRLVVEEDLEYALGAH